eukprot:1149097-Pelagomonas_calceolata.AAC.2
MRNVSRFRLRAHCLKLCQPYQTIAHTLTGAESELKVLPTESVVPGHNNNNQFTGYRRKEGLLSKRLTASLFIKKKKYKEREAGVDVVP